MTLAKICGLTTPETLDAALNGGAAFVGAVVFPKSPRHIDPLVAATLFDRARGRAKIVAVLVDPDDALLTQVGVILKPDLIQLHGHETPDRAVAARRLTGAGIIKALPIRDAADFAAAFEGRPEPLDQIFYCAESVLLPEYRGQGIGHAFFDARESHARDLGLTFSAFCSVIRPADHPARPAGYRPLDDFWRKRGYQPLPGVVAQFSWRDLGDKAETEKDLQFWMRSL